MDSTYKNSQYLLWLKELRNIPRYANQINILFNHFIPSNKY